MIKILGKEYKVEFHFNCYTLFIPDVCVIYITRDNVHSYNVRMFFYDSKLIFCSEHLRSKYSALSYIQDEIDFLRLNDIFESQRSY